MFRVLIRRCTSRCSGLRRNRKVLFLGTDYTGNRPIYLNPVNKKRKINFDEELLVKNFYVVFEAIIDELIGDKPLPDGMDKKQEDGKIVDHLFSAPSAYFRYFQRW